MAGVSHDVDKAVLYDGSSPVFTCADVDKAVLYDGSSPVLLWGLR